MRTEAVWVERWGARSDQRSLRDEAQLLSRIHRWCGRAGRRMRAISG